MHQNVFISYAKEDIDAAEKLFDFLSSHSYDPWLDKKKLLPGQQWNTEIKLALKKADFIILLLSKTSVAKRGFVQREFRLALEYCEEKLDTDIYIIPCKMDNCDVPEKLQKYQWVELNAQNSFEQILLSLNRQRDKYLEEEKLKIALNTSFEFKEIKIEKILGEKPKNYIEIIYPKFTNTSNEDLLMLNTYIEYLAFKSYNSSLVPYGQVLFPDNSYRENNHFGDLATNSNYKFELITKNIISFTIFGYTYSGGAHGLYGTSGYNYKLSPLQEFDLETLLDNDADTLKTLKQLCIEKLLTKAKDEFEIYEASAFFLHPDVLDEKWGTYSNFYLQKNSLVIIFTIYQITAYALGQHEVIISFDELLGLHKNLNTLKKLQDLLQE
jgi:hypothetical protein